MGNERLDLSTGQILSILFYVLESPARLFRPLHLANGQLFFVLDLLALRIPNEYVDPLLRLLDVCIKKQKESNPEEMGEMLGAALNCAILHDCKQLVQYLLDKLCLTGAQTLRAGRSPFPLASVFEGDVSKSNLLPAAVRSSLEKAESVCSMSALVVACLAGSIDSIEMLHARQITFDFSQVSY